MGANQLLSRTVSGCLYCLMVKNQKLAWPKRQSRIRSSVVVAELDLESVRANSFHNGAYLAPDQASQR